MPDKKSFILYLDRKKEIDLLSNEQCGILFKAIFQYVDTGNVPEIENLTVKVLFSFIASQIDENAKKWKETCRKRSEAGKRGGAPKGNKNASKQPKQANAFSNKQKQPKQADTDTVTDTVTVLSLSKDNDNIQQQASTAPKGAAQPADDEYDYIEIDETSGEWA